MSVISMNIFDTEREFTDHIIEKIDSISLIMLTIDFQCSNSRCIINGSILKTFNLSPGRIIEKQKLDVNLNLMTRNYFSKHCKHR